jgi:hypothetical protein
MERTVGSLLASVRLIGEQVRLRTDDGRLLAIMTAGGKAVAERIVARDLSRLLLKYPGSPVNVHLNQVPRYMI